MGELFRFGNLLLDFIGDFLLLGVEIRADGEERLHFAQLELALADCFQAPRGHNLGVDCAAVLLHVLRQKANITGGFLGQQLEQRLLPHEGEHLRAVDL